MCQSSDSFWDMYHSLVRRLLRPLGKSDGCSGQRVLEAEQRLGLTLPRLLREFYLLAGEREDINAVFNRLLPPESLSVNGNVLVFFEENQNTCLWGVDVRHLSLDDPAVLREDSAVSPIWEPDFDHLSQFWIAMLFLQAVNGGMRYVGVGSAIGTYIAQAVSDWETVHLDGSWNNNVLMRDGQVLYIYGEGLAPEVFGGARTKRKFQALQRAFAVSWDYCTLDDE